MRVAFYGRVSTEEQADRGNIVSQLNFARQYFSLHGPEEKIDGYEVYLDEGVSGTIPLEERPGGARLMSDARLGKISAVYFYRLDRLARSTQIVLNTYKELEKLNVYIKSMTEAFDTGTPVGKFFMTLLASIAALERDTILERTQLGKERKSREGCWTSGPPPFGYRVGTDGKLAVYEPEAGTVRLIFRLYNEGMSMVPLAEYLNARGIPTPNVSKSWKAGSSGLWHAAHISIILRSAVYTGKYRTMRRSQKGRSGIIIEVPEIISLADFERAGRQLSANGDAARGLRGREYLLRGLIFCGLCGRAMVGNTTGGGKRRYYYRCTGTINHGQGKCCGNKQVRAEKIEKVIWEDIKEFIKKPGKIFEVALTRLEGTKEPGGDEGELGQIELSIVRKKEVRLRILSMIGRNIITQEEAERQLQIMKAEMDLLRRRREDILQCREENNKIGAFAAEDPALLEKVIWKVNNMQPRADIIKLLVKRVEIGIDEDSPAKVGRVSIHYRFKRP